MADKLFAGRTKAIRVAGSVLIDQALFTPVLYVGHYIVYEMIAKRAIREGFNEGWAYAKCKMKKTMIADLAVWPLATGINLWFVPLQYQVLYVNIVDLGWDVILSKILNSD